MKKGLLIILFSFFTVFIAAQSNEASKVIVGDILVIGEPTSSEYRHIEIPKANFIVKRGGIANVKALVKMKVVVEAIHTKNGKLYASLKRKDRGKFFGSHPVLKAYLEEGISKGELIVPN